MNGRPPARPLTRCDRDSCCDGGLLPVGKRTGRVLVRLRREEVRTMKLARQLMEKTLGLDIS